MAQRGIIGLNPGRFGGAQQGAITPGQKRKGVKNGKAEGDLGVREVVSLDEVTEVVSEVGYDQQNKEIVVTKAPIAASSAEILVARIIGGNTLTGGLPGIKWISAPASVATVIDPYTDPALADGVGYGYLYLNGVQQFIAGPTPQRVLLYHYLTFVRFALLAGEFVLLHPTTVVIPGAGANAAYQIKGM